MVNKDKTGNDRQARRREKERAWLKKQGYKSWEALHTALMLGKIILQSTSQSNLIDKIVKVQE